MSKLIKMFEDMWVSVTFAEAGEHSVAQELVSHNNRSEEANICPVM